MIRIANRRIEIDAETAECQHRRARTIGAFARVLSQRFPRAPSRSEGSREREARSRCASLRRDYLQSRDGFANTSEVGQTSRKRPAAAPSARHTEETPEVINSLLFVTLGGKSPTDSDPVDSIKPLPSPFNPLRPYLFPGHQGQTVFSYGRVFFKTQMAQLDNNNNNFNTHKTSFNIYLTIYNNSLDR